MVIIISTCYYSFWKVQQMVLIPTMHTILAVYLYAPNILIRGEGVETPNSPPPPEEEICGTNDTHAHTKEKKKLAATKWSCRPSETLGCLGTTQVLRVSAGKFTRGKASTSQVGLYHAHG